MPTTVATDDFNRADSSTLGSNWTNAADFGTGSRIVSNEAVNEAGSNRSWDYWNANSFDNDQYAFCTSKQATNRAGPSVRSSGSVGSGNAYYLQGDVYGDAVMVLQKVVSNTRTELYYTGVSCTTNDVLRIEAEGTSLRVYKNGTQAGTTQTDSSLGSGAAGIFTFSGKVDDWEGGNLGSGSSTKPWYAYGWQ